jgi:hypothetical protein
VARGRYRITVWYLSREHLLGGVPRASTSVRRPPLERVWTFAASGPPPPPERASRWCVRYRPKGGEAVEVTLDMRFVLDVEALSGAPKPP